MSSPTTDWLDLCLPLTKEMEGLRLQAYPDPASGGDPWTIGYGATGPKIKRGTVWTQEQADSDLISRLQTIGWQVDQSVLVPLSPQQKAALVDFVYNVGIGNFRGSTLLRKLNSGDYKGAAAEFPRWNLAAGKVMPGLVRRRKAEQDLFLQ